MGRLIPCRRCQRHTQFQRLDFQTQWYEIIETALSALSAITVVMGNHIWISIIVITVIHQHIGQFLMNTVFISMLLEKCIEERTRVSKNEKGIISGLY